MYIQLLIAALCGSAGGGANLLYEKFMMNGEITKAKIVERVGEGVFAASLAFFGLAEFATTSFDVAAIAAEFGWEKVANFAAMSVPFMATGYFADDVIDAFIAKTKKKLGMGE